MAVNNWILDQKASDQIIYFYICEKAVEGILRRKQWNTGEEMLNVKHK